MWRQPRVRLSDADQDSSWRVVHDGRQPGRIRRQPILGACANVMDHRRCAPEHTCQLVLGPLFAVLIVLGTWPVTYSTKLLPRKPWPPRGSARGSVRPDRIESCNPQKKCRGMGDTGLEPRRGAQVW